MLFADAIKAIPTSTLRDIEQQLRQHGAQTARRAGMADIIKQELEERRELFGEQEV